MVKSMTASSSMPGDVLDPDLWQWVSAAISAVNAKIDEYEAGGGLVPTMAVPVMEVRDDSGWPAVRFSSAPGDEASDYPRLFGPVSGIITPFSYDDVPELAAVIEYVSRRPDLVSRLDIIPRPGQAALNDSVLWLVRLRAADLVLSVVSRARALGHPDDPETLLTAYRERERAILAPDLVADLIAPLVLTSLDLDGQLELGDGVRLEKLDEPIQLARACAYSGHADTVPSPLQAAATHAVVITGVRVDNSSPALRDWPRLTPDITSGKLDLALECLRVVTHVPVGYAQVFLRPAGWTDRWAQALPPVADTRVYRRYPSSFDSYGWLRTPVTVSAEQLAALPTVVAAARTVEKPTRLALRRLSLAGLRDEEDDMMIDACIGIEALLSKDNTEVTHKVALRGATVLTARSARPIAPKEAFDMLKKAYGRRSDLVHGNRSDAKATYTFDGGATIRTSALAVILLRDILLSKLTSDPTWTIDGLDDALLLSLTQTQADQDAIPAAEAPVSSPGGGQPA